jgi:WD40 repeat protein
VNESIYQGSLNEVAISQSGNNLVEAGNEGISLLDLTNLKQKPLDFKDSSGSARQMLFSSDNATLATLGNDGLLLWDIKDVENPKQLGVIPGRISVYRFSQDSKSITYIEQNGTVSKISVQDAVQQATQQNASSVMRDVCPRVLSPSGALVVKPENKKLQILSVDNQNKIAELGDQIESCPRSMAFSIDEKAFAYTDGNRIYVSFEEEGIPFKKKIVLFGKPEDNPPYVDLAFVSGENLLITRNGAGKIFLWSIPKRTQRAASELPGEPTVFADGKVLTYLRPENKFVLIDFTPEEWTKTLESWQRSLCEKVRPKLSEAEQAQYFSDEYINHYKYTCVP